MDHTALNLKAALHLTRIGIPCFPCGPDKKPRVKWKDCATTCEDTVRAWWRKFPDALPAFPTGSASGLDVVDLDVRNGKDGIAAYRRLGLDPAHAIVACRTASGGLHLYFEHRDGVRNSQDRIAPGIDVRGDGGYVIAPGATGPAGVYELLHGQLDIVPIFGEGMPDQLRLADRGTVQGVQVRTPPTLDTLRDPLFRIPNDGPREQWIRVLLAVHAASSGSAEGLALVQEWSADYPGYDPAEVEEQWRSFRLRETGGITFRTLLSEARKYGWDGVIAEDFHDEEGHEAPEGGDETRQSPIDRLNKRYALVRLGGNTAIADFRPNGDIDFLSTKAFRELHANRRYGMQTLGSAWMGHARRRTYENGVVFDPSEAERPGTLNLWRGWDVAPNPRANCDLILDHILHVLACGNELHAAYILSWLADIIQNPSQKPGVALVLKGRKGAGKDTLAEIMKAIVGRRHSAHVASSDRLTGRFNAAFATAVLIHVEEAIWGGQHEAKGVLQSLITCPSMPLERKHVDTVQVDNYSRLLLTTNESWAIPATADERRYAVFEVSPGRIGDRPYFDALYRQVPNGGLGAFLAFLQAWKTPDDIELRNPPRTRGLMEQKLSGLRNVDRWWHETLCDGTLCEVDFSEGNWSRSELVIARDDLRQNYEDWMRRHHHQGELKGPSEFGDALRNLCPAVESCRPNGAGRRQRKYRFPPLEQCRDAFVRAMGGASGDVKWGT